MILVSLCSWQKAGWDTRDQGVEFWTYKWLTGKSLSLTRRTKKHWRKMSCILSYILVHHSSLQSSKSRLHEWSLRLDLCVQLDLRPQVRFRIRVMYWTLEKLEGATNAMILGFMGFILPVRLNNVVIWLRIIIGVKKVFSRCGTGIWWMTRLSDMCGAWTLKGFSSALLCLTLDLPGSALTIMSTRWQYHRLVRLWYSRKCLILFCVFNYFSVFCPVNFPQWIYKINI